MTCPPKTPRPRKGIDSDFERKRFVSSCSISRVEVITSCSGSLETGIMGRFQRLGHFMDLDFMQCCSNPVSNRVARHVARDRKHLIASESTLEFHRECADNSRTLSQYPWLAPRFANLASIHVQRIMLRHQDPRAAVCSAFHP